MLNNLSPAVQIFFHYSVLFLPSVLSPGGKDLYACPIVTFPTLSARLRMFDKRNSSSPAAFLSCLLYAFCFYSLLIMSIRSPRHSSSLFVRVIPFIGLPSWECLLRSYIGCLSYQETRLSCNVSPDHYLLLSIKQAFIW